MLTLPGIRVPSLLRGSTLALITFLLPAIGTATPVTKPDPQGVAYGVFVYDVTHNAPLELARVMLRGPAKHVIGKLTGPTGHAAFRDVAPGRYQLVVSYVGYRAYSDSVTIDASHVFDSIGLTELSSDIVVGASTEPPITTFDPATGNQVFETETYHSAPTARITELVQQNMLGAARAPTGEIHIRGQHGEFTYYVDGAPIPLGVFGGLNEIVDPNVINRAIFWTGGWPAEYGGQIAGVVDLQTRVPSGHLQLDASTYVGSYLPNTTKHDVVEPDRAINSNGQTLSISDNIGKLGFFVSGTRQETDRRIDAPTQKISHDHGFDYFIYGKADYLLSDKELLSMNLNFGKTNTEVPFDSIVDGVRDDRQVTTNAFQTLSYFRSISHELDRESNLLITGYAREGSLAYTPGGGGAFTFTTEQDPDPLALSEDRSFTTIGLRTKFDDRLSHVLQYAIGGNLSATNGRAYFTTVNEKGDAGPAFLSEFTGTNAGIFGQLEWHPLEWMRIDAGLRYDQHIAPDIPMETQLSPRLKWNLLLSEEDNAYLYFGRLFMPNNIEGLRSLAGAVGTSATGTLAERDAFYEAVYEHSFEFGLRSKLAYFRKDASPGLDDETLGSSSVKTPVNIEHVHTQGVELGLSFSSTTTSFSGYLNTALIHAYGEGKILGGFRPVEDAGPASDLDHDQRLSIVASLNYQPSNWFANVTAIYGSGLTNGNPSGANMSTGLFDFNQFAHTTPSWIINVGAGYIFHLEGGTSIEPSIYVRNLLDHEHLLKGVFLSGASWEEPRELVFKLQAHF